MDITAQGSPQAWQLQAGQTAYLPVAAGDWLVVGHGPVHLLGGMGPQLRLDGGEAWQAPANGWVRLSSPGGAEWVHWASPAGRTGLRGLLRRWFGERRRALAASGPAV